MSAISPPTYAPFFLLKNNLGLGTEHAANFEKARELVQEGVNLLTQRVPEFLSERGWVAAQGLSLKVLESCEATLILADKGMSGAAWAPLRTAWESFIFAAALWRNPARYADFNDAHHKERLTQVVALKRMAPPSLAKCAVDKLDQLAEDTSVHKKWPCFNAAEEAGLKQEYELFYRGCGLAGAHATERSLDRHLTQLPGAPAKEYVWTYGPDFFMTEFMLAATIQCLAMTMDRFQERLTDLSRQAQTHE